MRRPRAFLADSAVAVAQFGNLSVKISKYLYEGSTSIFERPHLNSKEVLGWD